MSEWQEQAGRVEYEQKALFADPFIPTRDDGEPYGAYVRRVFREHRKRELAANAHPERSAAMRSMHARAPTRTAQSVCSARNNFRSQDCNSRYGLL